MNRYSKPRWPAWMVLAVTATVFLFGSIGILGAKMIDSEWRAGNVVLSLRAEANQLQASRKEALIHAGLQPAQSAAPIESDRQKIAQWQDIVSQIQHPYFKAQIANLLESAKVYAPALWTEHPIPLSQFTENNRLLLDTLYQRSPPLDEPTTVLAQLGTGAIDSLKKLVFLDAASCLHTRDRERFERALATFYQINQTYWGDLHSSEPMVCLLHRALDVKLLSPQDVEIWVNRLCKQPVGASYWDTQEQDRIVRLQTFSGFDRTSSGWWVPPSVMLAQAQYESTRRKEREDRWNPASIYREPAHKLALLGARIALLNHIQQQSLPISMTELETTPVIQNVGKAIAGLLNESTSSLIEYSKMGEAEAILRTTDMEALWKGSYPVHETYTVQLGSP